MKTVIENRLRCQGRKTLLLSPRAARPCRFLARHTRVPDVLGRQIWVFAALILMSVLSYYVINRFALSTVIVQGRSMAPTLEDGDRFLLNRLSFLCREPRRGDLVVLHDPGHRDLAVKRIVGLPGEKVEIKQGQLFVNNRRLHEIYLAAGTQTVLPKGREVSVVLAKGDYFVLGDNRDYSEDSRTYGPVDRAEIIGTLVK